MSSQQPWGPQPYGGPPQPWEQPAQQRNRAKERQVMRIAAAATVLAGVLLGIVIVATDGGGGDPRGSEVTRASFEASGSTWPLTVDRGRVSCERGNLLVFTDTAGTRYAINGVARSHLGLSEIDEIWAPRPDVPGLRVNIDDLFSAAEQEC